MSRRYPLPANYERDKASIPDTHCGCLGWIAHASGQFWHRNPFPIATDFANEWAEGWNARDELYPHPDWPVFHAELEEYFKSGEAKPGSLLEKAFAADGRRAA